MKEDRIENIKGVACDKVKYYFVDLFSAVCVCVCVCVWPGPNIKFICIFSSCFFEGGTQIGIDLYFICRF